MDIRSESFVDDQPIPAEFAFGAPDADQHVRLAPNRNPQLSWSGAPANTRSFVITCIDVDVPTRPDDVNQDGREVPADLPRTEFVHWLCADIPAAVTEIAAGSCSDGVEARGKRSLRGPEGSRQGVNDYTGWFADDPDMAGTWRGYDGPCPPWNDSLVHHYHFTVYALDVAKLPLPGEFGLAELREAMEGHVLDDAAIVGTYTLNPRLR